MYDDESDILGGQTLPIIRGRGTREQTNMTLSIKIGSASLLMFFGYVVFFHASTRFRKWQEKRYKLATRRKHGIPDSDHRPFNVAYAAATRARQENTSKAKNQLEPQLARNVFAEAQNPRQRSATGGQRNAASALAYDEIYPTSSHYQSTTGAGSSSARVQGPAFNHADPVNFTDRYNPVPPENRIHETDVPPRLPNSPATTRRKKRDPIIDMNNNYEDRKKRALDEENDSEHEFTKKTRVEGEELIDGDEDAVWQEHLLYSSRPSRGSKRVLGDEGDTPESKSTRDKRPRKVPVEYTVNDEFMESWDGDGTAENDELTELKSISRGKKRDRAEAGSTFGGDDVNSAPEDEGYESSKIGRTRKRRTVSKRKSDVSARGKKRDRDAESGDSEVEEEGGQSKKRSGRKKRGKKAVIEEVSEEEASDVSMADSNVSKDPLCKGRRIGEEWEVNGIQYRVGPNGDRLRQALVKKARSKFIMPQDSQHPDRQAHLEVFVESWLTEEQYKEAKDRQELAWQDSPKVSPEASVEPETPGNVPESPSKFGKNLLWSSTSQNPTPKRRPFRQSIAANMGIRINPFEQTPPSPRRRVASAYASPASTTVDLLPSSSSATSTPQRPHRSFSKWEKQDLEAEAMKKMRQKMQEQKKIEADAEKKPDPSAGGNTTAPSSTAPALAPTINLPPKSDPAPMISFGPPPAADPSTLGSSATSAGPPAVPKITLTPPSATTATFNAEQIKPPANPFTPSLSAPAMPTTSSAPSFSFQPTTNKPPQPPASSGPSDSNPPPNNFFAAPLSRQASSNAGTSAPSAPSAPLNAAPKPVFSFNAPVTSGSATPSTGSVRNQFSFGNMGGNKTTNSGFNPSYSAGAGGVQGEQQKKTEQAIGSTGGGPSLLARLGPSGGSQTANSSGNGSTFTFAKPGAPASTGGQSKPISVFGNLGASANPPPAATTPSDSAPPSGPLKFNFGISNKPPSTTVPTPVATPAPDPSKPSVTSFGFPSAKPAVSSPLSGPSMSGSTLKFPVTSSTGSTFGSTSAMGTGSVQAKDASNETQSFAGFSGGTSGPFSNKPMASESPFGGTLGGSVFGGSSTSTGQQGQSPFSVGNTGSSKADASKSTFTLPSTGTSTSGTGESSKSPFTMGSSSSTFKFGVTPTPTFGAQSADSQASNPFAKPAQSNPSPAMFGFPSGNSGTFTFGAPSNTTNSGQNQQQ